MIDPATGAWLYNVTCKRCRHRHPAEWSCMRAAIVAAQARARIVAALGDTEPEPEPPVAGLLAAALVDAGMTGTAAEATALQLLEDFRVEPRR